MESCGFLQVTNLIHLIVAALAKSSQSDPSGVVMFLHFSPGHVTLSEERQPPPPTSNSGPVCCLTHLRASPTLPCSNVVNFLVYLT